MSSQSAPSESAPAESAPSESVPAERASSESAPPEPDEFTLASLVASRICHDLISPIAAISTGVEVLEDEDESMRAHAMELLQSSSRQAGVKLEFARLAFGAAGALGAKINLGEGARLTRRLFSFLKADLDWRAAEIEIDKDLVKIVMNLCLIASETIPRGGEVILDFDADRGFEIIATGPRAKLYDRTRDALTGAGGELDAKTIPAFLARRLLQRLGMTLSIEADDAGIRFSTRNTPARSEAAA